MEELVEDSVPADSVGVSELDVSGEELAPVVADPSGGGAGWHPVSAVSVTITMASQVARRCLIRKEGPPSLLRLICPGFLLDHVQCMALRRLETMSLPKLSAKRSKLPDQKGPLSVVFCPLDGGSVGVCGLGVSPQTPEKIGPDGMEEMEPAQAQTVQQGERRRRAFHLRHRHCAVEGDDGTGRDCQELVIEFEDLPPVR